MGALIAPSILAADFTRLGEEVAACDQAGADWIHIDVMDGHFVPNLSFGAGLVQHLRRWSPKPFDVHLMLSQPSRYAAAFRYAGADWISWHIECDERPSEVLRCLEATGAKIGVCLKPATPLSAVEEILARVNLVVVMSVEPGLGGQSFMAEMMSKVAELKKRRQALGAGFLIEVDGGVDAKTASQALQAGADVLVAGTAIFKEKDYVSAIASLRGADRGLLE